MSFMQVIKPHHEEQRGQDDQWGRMIVCDCADMIAFRGVGILPVSRK
ncbi:hypothetical protein BN1095_3870001 [Clostridioides difficile]|uniref:Uncharacterized protein n=1 Tax=Clostridioides difficile TaxID=1496 RepID=A0A069APE4_CLODI|nr:hypothetical protein BN1095_3870001 [Clostridioides difficile]